MLKLDAHQHFWIYDELRHSWISDEMWVLRRNFLPTDLEPLLRQHHLAGCIAVQADQTPQENDFLLELAERHEFIKGVVGWVDLRAKDISAHLDRLKEQPKLKGFRHILQSEPDRAMMLRPDFKRGIACLEQYGFTYDILVYPDQLGFVSSLVKCFPNQRFVLDHIGKPPIKKQEPAVWKSDMTELAGCENVFCKVSGLVTEADWHNWSYADLLPYFDSVFELFGAGRLMFGSDWPVSLLASNYAEVLDVADQYLDTLSEAEQTQFWSGNAEKFYGLTR